MSRRRIACMYSPGVPLSILAVTFSVSTSLPSAASGAGSSADGPVTGVPDSQSKGQ